jgi:hypothetical protein
MADRKYEKYILTEQKLPKHLQARELGPRILHLDNNVIEGAFYLSAGWWLTAANPKAAAESHRHDFDEVVAFFGSNPEDPLDLGGEVEFWLGDEKYNITKSCLIFIPKGLKHCPIRRLRVDRPILHFSTAPVRSYSKEE